MFKKSGPHDLRLKARVFTMDVWMEGYMFAINKVGLEATAENAKAAWVEWQLAVERRNSWQYS